MSTTDKISYSSSSTITCTLASLASSNTAGRRSAVVDNSSTLYDDMLLLVQIKTGSGTLANDKTTYIYLGATFDGTNWSGSSAENWGGGDGAITFDSPTNAAGPIPIACPASATEYSKWISVAQMFGGVMPQKWAYASQNYTGQTFDATGTNFISECVGIYYTNG